MFLYKKILTDRKTLKYSKNRELDDLQFVPKT